MGHWVQVADLRVGSECSHHQTGSSKAQQRVPIAGCARGSLQWPAERFGPSDYYPKYAKLAKRVLKETSKVSKVLKSLNQKLPEAVSGLTPSPPPVSRDAGVGGLAAVRLP